MADNTVEKALQYYDTRVAPRIADPNCLCSPREYYYEALALEVRRLRAKEYPYGTGMEGMEECTRRS